MQISHNISGITGPKFTITIVLFHPWDQCNYPMRFVHPNLEHACAHLYILTGVA